MQSAPRIPPMTVTEVYNALVHLKQTGTRAQDSLDGKIHKLPAPVVSDTPNVCLQSLYTDMLRSGCFHAGQIQSSVQIWKELRSAFQFLSCQFSQSHFKIKIA